MFFWNTSFLIKVLEWRETCAKLIFRRLDKPKCEKRLVENIIFVREIVRITLNHFHRGGI